MPRATAKATVPAQQEQAIVAVFDDFRKHYKFDPKRYVREVLNADPDPWQDEVLEAYKLALLKQGPTRLTIRSGHGPGKTALLSWIAQHHQTFFFPQKTICTAASEGQLKDGLIAEIKTWISRLKPELQQLFDVQMERILLVIAPEESFISFRVSKAENPEALAGVHSAHVLLICDEASGIPNAIFESASGSMADPNSIMILAGNMVRNQGFFYDSHYRDTIGEWKKFHINSEDSPRVSQQFIQSAREKYGVRSNYYRIRILGEPPLADDNAIIPYELASFALTRDVQLIPGIRPIWGVDVARFGSDASALAKRRGNMLMEKVKTWYGLDIMQTTGTVKAEWDTTPEKDRPSEILVDVIGYGAGVCDRLRELQLPARGINVSESPSVLNTYKNLRTELLFKVKEWLGKRDCNLCGDQELVDEMVAPSYKILNSNGLMLAESKDDMKSRGIASPNRLDAFALTMASDHATGLHGKDRKRDWRTPLQRVIRGLV